jgi:hypothetical protein
VAETAGEHPLTEYSEDGVDLTLIRWFLSLSPFERIEFLEDQIDDILTVQELNGQRTNYDRKTLSSDSGDDVPQ